MSRLNANQTRHVLATFRYVDSLLEHAGRLTVPSESAFAKERADVSEEEARVLHAYAEEVRQQMLAALNELGIVLPPRSESARWAVETNLRMADISLSELGRNSLRKGGSVDDETAMQLSALAADLRAVLARAKQALRRAPRARPEPSRPPPGHGER